VRVSVLQCAALHLIASALRSIVSTLCMLQCGVECQCVAVHSIAFVRICAALYCFPQMYIAVRCSVLQCVAVRELCQCVAVCSITFDAPALYNIVFTATRRWWKEHERWCEVGGEGR